MLPEELVHLIDEVRHQKCERRDLELKTAAKGTPERLYDTLSAFANQTDGGILLFGMSEKENYTVTGVYDAQDLQVKVTNAALQMEPVIRPIFTVAEYDGKTVVSAEIPECDINEKPCYYKGAGKLRGSYVRFGESDQPMTEYEIYSYEVYKKKIRDELRPVERASKQDFSALNLQNYLLKIRENKKQLEKAEEDQLLRLQGMMAGEQPTVAGINLLCDYPQSYFPQLGITAMLVDGTEIGTIGRDGERFIDNQRIEGNIPQMLEEALRFVRRNMKNATVIDQNGHRADKTEYPIIAIREIILNALVHRDYSAMSEDSPIRIVMYKDRIEVENPGGLYGRLSVSDLGKLPGDTRNPFLAGNLEVLIGTENRFSGIPTIYRQMEEWHLMPPVFESKRGNFKVTLYNRPAGSEREQIEEEKILNFCREPKSKEDIAGLLNMKTTCYVVKNYLRPLIEQGKLAMTIPERPQSKSQKYYATS